MSDLVNKHRGEIALPEAGEGAFLRFTVDSLEKLEAKYGEDYLDDILKGMTKGRVGVFQAVVSVSANEAKAPFPFGLSLEELQTRIVDALFLFLHGRTYEEQQKHEDEIFQKRMEEAKTNPRMAAALFSRQSGE